MGQFEDKITALGIDLPNAPAPAANYIPSIRTGNLLFISGQVAIKGDGTKMTGTLGDDCDIDAGVAAARQCAINIIAQAKTAIGDLDNVAQIIKLTGFVNSTTDFIQQPQIINGASDLFVEVFGDKGRHSRSAVGVASLPFGVAVEIEAIIEVK